MIRSSCFNKIADWDVWSPWSPEACRKAVRSYLKGTLQATKDIKTERRRIIKEGRGVEMDLLKLIDGTAMSLVWVNAL